MISEFPLFLFTLLGGMSAGTYALLAVLKRREDGDAVILPVVALILLVISGFALFGHLGRPAGALQVMGHPTTGIGFEGYGSLLFGLFVLIDLIICAAKKKPNHVVTVLAGIFGLILLVAMGYAYYEVMGIEQWGNAASFAMFIFGGLALGVPLAAFFVEEGYGNSRFRLVAALAIALGVIALLIENGVFGGLGLSTNAFMIGAVLLAIAFVLVLVNRKNAVWITWLIFVLVVVGMAIARYSFYMI